MTIIIEIVYILTPQRLDKYPTQMIQFKKFTMNKIILFFISTLIIGCDFRGNSNNATIKTLEANSDSGFIVTRTDKLITGKATIAYTNKNRDKSQFALDISTKKEEQKDFLIKTSDRKILITDIDNKIIREYQIEKKWIKKSGPETVYDLIDSNKVECSLTHYIDIEKHHYFSFRFENVLETYSDE